MGLHRYCIGLVALVGACLCLGFIHWVLVEPLEWKVGKYSALLNGNYTVLRQNQAGESNLKAGRVRGVRNEAINEKYNASWGHDEQERKNNERDAKSFPNPNDPALQQELRRRLGNATEKKIIIDWYGHSSGVKINAAECGNCEVTNNKQKITENATGAVIFTFLKISQETMPTSRNPEHLYIYWEGEPTPIVRYSHRKDLKFEDSYGFNATMTYRRDSDFYDSVYTARINGAFRSGNMTENDLKLKKKEGVAFVSNCERRAGARLRMKMLAKIKQTGYELTTFGKCFPDSSGTSRKPPSELERATRQHKFYFSFENSYHCKDYITEKVFRNAFHYRAVPVVFGGAKTDYEDLLPKGSYIFLEDFSSIKKLVEYLQYLNKNDTAYLEYFKWLNEPLKNNPQAGRASRLCHICRVLHGINFDDVYNPRYGPTNPIPWPLFDERVSRRTMPSLSGWLYDEEPDECFEQDETKLPVYSKYGLS